ncbi:UPF0764 protein C16orf89 homolog [Peromyscus californicus insignis]|uniref:UPF0764 protein C16orf89 homolog n=1 Tax=Peromyscus californicus insignis TaxID=564181 RepID=UPI0022A6EF37|nr:UPF0764 protein C16orf89 homolog [Peromyscus californicus insignis]
MARFRLFLLLLLALPPQSSSLPWPDTAQGTMAGLILTALEKATLFLEGRLPLINLDGAVGFQVLEVQLRGVQGKWASDPLLQPLSLRAGQLANTLSVLLQKSIFYLKQSDPTYLREFQPSIQPGFWKLPHAWTRTNASLVYPQLEPLDSFSEESSDACLVQLLGTGTDRSQPCRLSSFCRTLMTKAGCSGYSLSHQLLFFLWARMQGCTEGLFRQSQHYMNVFCANMMELNRRAEAIRYAYPTQDLFMENIMFCGMAGFSDFYKLRWLEAILSWQKPQLGCFGKPDAKGELPEGTPHRQGVLRRVRRRERLFTDGCSCHNTATAVAALGGFLYILAEYHPDNGEPHPPTPSPESNYQDSVSVPEVQRIGRPLSISS